MSSGSLPPLNSPQLPDLITPSPPVYIRFPLNLQSTVPHLLHSSPPLPCLSTNSTRSASMHNVLRYTLRRSLPILAQHKHSIQHSSSRRFTTRRLQFTSKQPFSYQSPSAQFPAAAHPFRRQFSSTSAAPPPNKSYTKITPIKTSEPQQNIQPPQPPPSRPDLPYTKPATRQFSPQDSARFRIHRRDEFAQNENSILSNLKHPTTWFTRSTSTSAALIFSLYIALDFLYIHAIFEEGYLDRVLAQQEFNIKEDTAKLHGEIKELERALDAKRYEITSSGKASMLSFDAKERAYAFESTLSNLSNRPVRAVFEQMRKERCEERFHTDLIEFIEREQSLGVNVSAWSYFTWHILHHPRNFNLYNKYQQKYDNGASFGQVLFDAIADFHPDSTPSTLLRNPYHRLHSLHETLTDTPTLPVELQKMIAERTPQVDASANFVAWHEDKINQHVAYCTHNDIPVDPEDIRTTPDHDLWELYRGQNGYLTLGLRPDPFEPILPPNLKYAGLFSMRYPEHGQQIVLNDFPSAAQLEDYDKQQRLRDSVSELEPQARTSVPIGGEIPGDIALNIDEMAKVARSAPQLLAYLSTQVEKAQKRAH